MLIRQTSIRICVDKTVTLFLSLEITRLNQRGQYV